MTISTKSAKAKARNLQRWVAGKVSALLNIPWGKDCDIEPRPMGQSGVDLILHGKAKKNFPWSVECKRCEKWAIPTWVRQAKKNEIEGTSWLLVCKRSMEKPIVILDAEAFFEILHRSDISDKR